MKVCVILKDVSINDFNTLHRKAIDKLIKKDEVILLTEAETVLSRYLSTHFYRNIIMYHCNANPKHNICKLSSNNLRGNFTSIADCEAQARLDCDKVYSI